MGKKRLLFLIHDLGQGGAEKVLVNLANNLNLDKYECTVMTLFGGGVNEQFLNPNIKYIAVFSRTIPANTLIFKFFPPTFLHRLFIRDCYDIEISYLEGPSARIISGCRNAATKTLCWIHSEQKSMKELSYAFQNKSEALTVYSSFDRIICVSESIRNSFLQTTNNCNQCEVLYNTVESDQILKYSKEIIDDYEYIGIPVMIAVGSLKPIKGMDRLLRVMKKLVDENIKSKLIVLGIGPMEEELKNYVIANGLESYVTFLGYRTNPYKYVAKADLFVCSSLSEGFSTAATEALIVGTAVCTVDVPGMKEMLGYNNEYGVIVDNNESALYEGLKNLLSSPDLLGHFTERAKERGKSFAKSETIKAVEKLLDIL